MIETIVRIPEQGLMAVAEQHSPIVQFYDITTGAKKDAWKFRAAAVPLAMTYIPEEQSLIMTCSDQSMAQWQLGQGSGGFKFSEKS